MSDERTKLVEETLGHVHSLVATVERDMEIRIADWLAEYNRTESSGIHLKAIEAIRSGRWRKQ